MKLKKIHPTGIFSQISFGVLHRTEASHVLISIAYINHIYVSQHDKMIELCSKLILNYIGKYMNQCPIIFHFL